MKATVICDGRGNAGTGAIAAVLTCHSEDSWTTISFEVEEARKLEPVTNIVAEHLSMQLGIELALRAGVTELLILNDSQTPVFQLQGKYKTKQPHLLPLVEQTWKLASDSQFSFIDVRWVPREHTERADFLCKQADGVSLPRSRLGELEAAAPQHQRPFRVKRKASRRKGRLGRKGRMG